MMFIEAQSSWFSPATIISIGTALITIAGWMITAYLARANTAQESKNAELNHLIDKLDDVLESIYHEMVELFSLKEEERSIYYHKFILAMAKVKFLCEEIEKIDSSQSIDFDSIGQLRQACTTDSNYQTNKIPQALSQVQASQQGLRARYSKRFN